MIFNQVLGNINDIKDLKIYRLNFKTKKSVSKEVSSLLVAFSSDEILLFIFSSKKVWIRWFLAILRKAMKDHIPINIKQIIKIIATDWKIIWTTCIAVVMF